jgi:hypothetical protein
MQTPRAKIVILVVLLGVWAAVFFLRRPGDTPVSPGSAPVQASPRAGRAAAGGSGTTGLKTELLNVPRAPYPSEVHNIFSNPPPPPPPVPSAMDAAAAAAAAAPPPPPPDPFQEEAKQLRYIGFLQSDGAATAFLVRGQEVYTASVGELAGGRFRIMEVRDESVLLGSPAGDKQVRLSLAGEAGSAGRTVEIGAPSASRAPAAPNVPLPPGAAQPRPGPRTIVSPPPAP